MTIANFKVRRILVDNGSSADILYWDAFKQMGIAIDKLEPSLNPLLGFAGDRVLPEGCITLPVTAGDAPNQSTVMVRFLVVKCPSVYNVILGRPTLNSLKAVTSTYHLAIKFPTERGVGVVRGDQFEARKCYATTIKDKGKIEEAMHVASAIEPTPLARSALLPLSGGERGAPFQRNTPLPLSRGE